MPIGTVRSPQVGLWLQDQACSIVVQMTKKCACRFHCHRMLHVLFDYGLNVKLCVAAGVVQTVLWVAWVIRRRHPGRSRMLLFLVRDCTC